MGSFCGSNPQTTVTSPTNSVIEPQRTAIYNEASRLYNQYAPDPTALVAGQTSTQQAATKALSDTVGAATPWTVQGENMMAKGFDLGQTAPGYYQQGAGIVNNAIPYIGQALASASNGASYLNLGSSGLGNISPVSATSWDVNPYLNTFTDTSARALATQWDYDTDMGQNNLAGIAAKQGNFLGGDRYPIAAAEYQRGRDRDLSAQQSAMYERQFQNAAQQALDQQKYKMALGLGNNENARAIAQLYGQYGSQSGQLADQYLRAAQTQGSLGTNIMNAGQGLTGVGSALSNIGLNYGNLANSSSQQQTAAAMAAYNAATGGQQTNQAMLNAPWTNLGFLVANSPGMNTVPTSTTYPGASPLGTIAGLGLAGAGIYAALNKNGSWRGGRIGYADGGEISEASAYVDPIAVWRRSLGSVKDAGGFASEGSSGFQPTSGAATAPKSSMASDLLATAIKLAPTIISMSDRRVKENIEIVGKTFDGQPLYRFNYKGDPRTQIGLIAQNVEKSHPNAVTTIDGIKHVDYVDATDDAVRRGHYDTGGAVSSLSGMAGLGNGSQGWARVLDRPMGAPSSNTNDMVSRLNHMTDALRKARGGGIDARHGYWAGGGPSESYSQEDNPYGYGYNADAASGGMMMAGASPRQPVPYGGASSWSAAPGATMDEPSGADDIAALAYQERGIPALTVRPDLKDYASVGSAYTPTAGTGTVRVSTTAGPASIGAMGGYDPMKYKAAFEVDRSQFIPEALLQAGLGMMAASGKRDARGLPSSPASAIGEGGMVGLGYMNERAKAALEANARAMEAKRLEDAFLHQRSAEAHQRALLAETIRAHNLEDARAAATLAEQKRVNTPAIGLRNAELAQFKTMTPDERRKVAPTLGLVPGSDEEISFIATGQYNPKNDTFDLGEGHSRFQKMRQPDGTYKVVPIATGGTKVDATTKKEISETDELLLKTKNAIMGSRQALSLNQDAYDGVAAYQRAQAAANLPFVPDDNAKKTIELNNIMMRSVLENLKPTFGGNPTEGERNILKDVEAAVNQPRDVREGVIRRAQRLAERQYEFNAEKVRLLRSGDYYGPRGQPQTLSEKLPERNLMFPERAPGEQIPPQSIRNLRSSPEALLDNGRTAQEEFDHKYGRGSSKNYLKSISEINRRLESSPDRGATPKAAAPPKPEQIRRSADIPVGTRETINGALYEKRTDGKWYPVTP